MQTHTSQGTARSQVPAIHKWGLLGTRNLDYGGGPFNKATEYLSGFGVANFVMDPYNRTLEHNFGVYTALKDTPAPSAIIANVLNVIPGQMNRNKVLSVVKALVERDGLILIACHPGNGSGVGQETLKGCWQENRPTRSYLQEVQAVFPSAYYKHGYIIATR